jgi:prepilin-type processing-associated H-X9-DG protein
MSETSSKRPRFRFRVFILEGIVVVLAAIVLLLFFVDSRRPPNRSEQRVACMSNLRDLGLALALYGNENGDLYPPAEQWCDLLARQFSRETGQSPKKFKKTRRCPEVAKDGWGYALNSLARLTGDPNVVLVFESDVGWNGFGGSELLVTGRHRGDGCNVLFVDGHVEFVKTEKLAGLKWTDPDSLPGELPNARRPRNDRELKSWLENMVWYHRFTTEEVRAATGLTEVGIRAAQVKFNIRPDGRPERDAGAPLLVLPYPGGRHPRIGFLAGAIDPQRETKFSVFTPWDANSYVVLDIPEAIWSNLGLTYLAHTHIDTIWTQQGIELEKLEWTRRLDGRLEIKRTLPNGIAFGAMVRPTPEAVHMEMWLKNGTTEPLSDLRVQNCVMPKMAAGFAALTNENKVFTDPYVACRNEEGTRWIITAWEGCQKPWGNEDCPCFHSDPKFPDLEPGQEHRLRGWLSFYEGQDIEGEFKRIEATGWRRP